MTLKQSLSAIRFGYGHALGQTAPFDEIALLGQLDAPGKVERQYKIADTEARIQLIMQRRASRKDGGEADRKRVDQEFRNQTFTDVRSMIQRMVASPQGFRERLTAFWADHFTVAAQGPVLSVLVPDFIETAIRPYVAGNFADMLQAASLHPAMLIYLNQNQSVGPNSTAGQRRDRGLNENLAREVLELHTLGVGGAYTQADVRQLAELLTGLGVDKNGFVFRRRVAEPGAETILGKEYGGNNPSLDHIRSALTDIALHPDTARHLAEKLVVHFVGGIPSDELVDRMAEAYLASKGNLVPLYEVMLSDPAVWQLPLRKVKPPLDFIVSALRAAGVSAKDLAALEPRRFRRELASSLTEMGQPLLRPKGPDGWPEDPEAWITPATLAARLRWCAGLVDEVLIDVDPREFLQNTLGQAASNILARAVAGSESRKEGAALVLVSPDFNRR